MRVRRTLARPLAAVLRLSRFEPLTIHPPTPLLSHPDNSFAFDIVHDDAVLATNLVSVQAALLYTTSNGERRIRVHTMAIPVTQIAGEVVKR